MMKSPIANIKHFCRLTKLNIALILTVALSLTTFKALADPNFKYCDNSRCDLNYFKNCSNYYCMPYVGIDAQWRMTPLADGFGNNVFKRHYVQGNLYVGAKLCDYLGLELGYEITPTRVKTSTLGPGESSIGVASRPPEVHLTRSRLKGLHFGIMGFYPVCHFYDNSLFKNPLELLGYVGATRLHCYYQDSIAIRDGLAVDVRDNTRTFNRHTTVLRLGLGAQYTYCTSGVRFMLGYESTGQLKELADRGYPSSRMRIKLHDSLFVSLGVFVTI